MAAKYKIRPPFSWLGPYTTAISVIGTLAIGAFFRFFQLGSLPPGLDTGTATIGLQALALVQHGTIPGMNSANGFAPLWVWLQATSVYLFGHTELALRVWPAILGTLAVLLTWLWARSWFGLRTAWLASFLVAVTPWAVTLSRSGTEAALWPFLVPTILWLGTLALKHRNVGLNLTFAVVMFLTLLCGPVGWLIFITTTIIGFMAMSHDQKSWLTDRSRLVGVTAVLVVLAIFGYLLAMARTSIKELPKASGFVTSSKDVATGIFKTILMFNVSGDQNYQHNLAGQPLLNAFVGLMLVAGILVSLSRFHDRRYILLLALTLVLLLPAIVTTVDAPDAARAAASIPLILTLASIGMTYMLELWYKTFPINSAARATGQLAIFILLGLTLFQGYSQYFQAWAGTTEVHSAYNEGAVQLASYMNQPSTKSSQNIVLAEPSELPIVAYLDQGRVAYTPIAIDNFAAYALSPGVHEFFITTSARDQATKTLKAKFPGGVLYPHYSSFNQAEIYYTYVVTK